MNNDTKRENRSGGGGRNTYFYVVLSRIWQENIHSIIKKLSESNGITWLHTQMSYNILPNLG